MKSKGNIIIILLLIFTLILGLSPTSMSGQDITVFLDGTPVVFDTPPVNEKGVTLVPFRDLFEALGSEVQWLEEDQTVLASKDNTIIKLILGSITAYIDDQEYALLAPPRIVNGRTLIPLRFVSEALGMEVEWRQTSKAIYIYSQLPHLPVVGTAEHLKELMEQGQNNHNTYFKTMFSGVRTLEAMPEAVTSAPSSDQKASSDYSSTNIQVQGVDEADIVKTDGEYIYQVNNNRIIIAKAFPASEMSVISNITFDDTSFSPYEIYIDEKHMVVIGAVGRYYDYKPMPMPMPMPREMIYPPIQFDNLVKAYIFDIKDKGNVKKLREIEVEGSYLSSRKIGSDLYLVANKEMSYHIMDAKNIETPTFRDSITGNGYKKVDLNEIHYFPKFIEPNYLIIAGLNLNEPNKPVNISTYLGSSENIYVSKENLYVASTTYEEVESSNISAKRMMPSHHERNTQVYKFALDKGNVNFVAEGKVPGNILNQFSMDEHNGYFRIATTTGEIWRDDEFTSKNNLYVLDGSMKVIGSVEDIAPGERIYSTRFMGDRAYMVTFKTVDPLFVIDLENPRSPKILGELKIPGYSDYLHPYDENHIIGFGKDTVEITQKDRLGNVVGVTAFDNGMKMAIFDVTDVNNPKEKFVEFIGDRGTESELLRNHKALLFSKEKNLLAFPVTLMEVTDNSSKIKDGFPPYGQFVFQGALIYNIDTTNGFGLRGRVTHLTNEDYQKAGSYWYHSDKNVDRILYIENTLYTLSKETIKAHDINTVKETNTLKIPISKN